MIDEARSIENRELAACAGPLEPPVRPRRITATITVDVYTLKTQDALKVATNRQRDLKDWLNRHRKEIENEMSLLDDVTIEIDIGYQDE